MTFSKVFPKTALKASKVLIKVSIIVPAYNEENTILKTLISIQELDYPIAPLIIGLVLGPIAEVSLRRAMILNNFDIIAVVTHPIAGVMLLISALSLIYGLYGQYRRQRERKKISFAP